MKLIDRYLPKVLASRVSIILKLVWRRIVNVFADIEKLDL
jgi:hypothetical protein